MAYATVDDLGEYIGTSNVTEYDRREGADSAAGALTEGHDLIDSYLARFKLPLSAPYPPSLVRANKIVTGYDVMVSLGYVREDDGSAYATRYAQIIKWLEQIAKSLVTPPGLEEPLPPGQDPFLGIGTFVQSDPPRGW